MFCDVMRQKFFPAPAGLVERSPAGSWEAAGEGEPSSAAVAHANAATAIILVILVIVVPPVVPWAKS